MSAVCSGRRLLSNRGSFVSIANSVNDDIQKGSTESAEPDAHDAMDQAPTAPAPPPRASHPKQPVLRMGSEVATAAYGGLVTVPAVWGIGKVREGRQACWWAGADAGLWWRLFLEYG